MRSLPVKQRPRIHLLQAGGVVFAACFILTQPVAAGLAHEIIELVGLGLVILCIAGRAWSILYVGSNKNQKLITTGPYSITRNPLYLFSTLGAVGVGLMFGSITTTIGLGLLAYGILVVTANKEAAHLRMAFGSRYEAYAHRTPFFWPKPSLFRDTPEVVFSPKALKRTVTDGLMLLLFFPLSETIEQLQIDGTLPILMRVF